MEKFLKALSLVALSVLIFTQTYLFFNNNNENLIDVFEPEGVPLEKEMFAFEKGFIQLELLGDSNGQEIFISVNGEYVNNFEDTNICTLDVKENDFIELYNSSVTDNNINAKILSCSEYFNEKMLSDTISSDSGRAVVGRIVVDDLVEK